MAYRRVLIVPAGVTALWLLAGCGAGALLEGEETRRGRVEAAVTEVLDRERDWQSRFIERRTETLVARQQQSGEEVSVLVRRLEGLEGRLDSVVRTQPRLLTDREPDNIAEPTPTPATPPAMAPAPPAIDEAEIEALRQDLDAMTEAVARLLADRNQAAAALRARLERLELRTSGLSWPAKDGTRAVHLASYRSHAAALAGWEILLGRYRPLLITENPTFIEVESVAGRYVRLYVGVGLDEGALNRILNAIRAGGDYGMILTLPGPPIPSS